MGDTKMFLFFSNVSTINAFVSEIVFYGIWTVVDLCMGVSDVSLQRMFPAEVNYCPDSIKYYFADEDVDRRNVWKE